MAESEMEIPDTMGERMEKHKNSGQPMMLHPDHPDNWDPRYHEKAAHLLWAAPYDARFPQVRKQRQCFEYYVDFFRCKELMGEDYKPCKFFKNVYKDICPSFWTEKWDELREEGRFPAKFDR
ncbi:hypothetical protein niasHT_030679 [Heterodera trifolii]|uniref:Uncharacterized protein n=1 Tax=Heterodera trifolii TaxID=157864 RepID=A0ABD2I5H1_9BILA